MGVDESDCPLPCDIFSTMTKRTVSRNTQDYTGFAINFQQDLEVKTYKLIFSLKNPVFVP